MLRRVTDIAAALSLVVMTASGVALLAWHEAGPDDLGGTVLGIDRIGWGEAHLVSSILFTIAAASHIRLNVAPLMRHFGVR